MHHDILVRISGNILDVSPDGKSALPQSARDLLEPVLRYTYIKILRGLDAIDFSGRRVPIREETRLMYDYDKYGRLVCLRGFYPRIYNLLTQAGVTVTSQDTTPQHKRTDRFTEDWTNLFRNFTFRARQEEAIKAVASNPFGTINAATGFGKTYLFRAIGLLYPHANIVITAKRRDVVDSIRSNLAAELPNIGQIGGGKHIPGRITVATADSLHKVDADQTDILIGEEVHELAADSYTAELLRFKHCRAYGVSASVNARMDNADMRLEGIFGPVIFQLTYQDAVELGLVVPIRVFWLDVHGDDPAAGMTNDVARKRHGIWRNNRRNQIIADAARTFTDDDQVLIMVTTFEHAVYLRQLLPEFTLCYAERTDESDFEMYKKQNMLADDEPIMTSKRRQDLRKAFEAGTLKKVIATDVWSTGVSFNKLSVLIRGDGRGSAIMDTQIPGRVCRLDDGKVVGVLLDCADQFSSSAYSTARKRRKNYAAHGWDQETFDFKKRSLISR